MTKMDLKQFKGKLQEPLKPRKKGLLRRTEKEQTRGEEILEKIGLLLDHYDLKVGSSDLGELPAYMILAYFLARDSGIAGFQEEKKRGRKQKWSDVIKAYLVADMVRIQALSVREISAREAARILSRKDPWKSFVESKDDSSASDPGETLRQIYSESKDSLYSSFLCGRMEKLVNNNKEAEWIVEVSSVVGK